jgi:hypothetical protein
MPRDTRLGDRIHLHNCYNQSVSGFADPFVLLIVGACCFKLTIMLSVIAGSPFRLITRAEKSP